jgi:hypothetical protein
VAVVVSEASKQASNETRKHTHPPCHDNLFWEEFKRVVYGEVRFRPVHQWVVGELGRALQPLLVDVLHPEKLKHLFVLRVCV